MMYDYFTSIITKELKKNSKYVISRDIENVYLYLLYIKYLGTLKEEKKELKILFKKSLEEVYNYLQTKYGLFPYYLKKINFIMLLKLMKEHDYKELLTEYLNLKENEDLEMLSIFKNPKDKILYLNDSENINSYPKNLSNYDYVAETIDGKIKPSLFRFKLIDQMLGRKVNHYNTINEVDINKYDLIVINDTEPYYIFSTSNEKNLIKSIYRYFYMKNSYQGKLILKTNFNKISKFPYERLIEKHLSKVIFHKDIKNLTVYMEFCLNSNDSISLILLNEELEKDTTKLKSLITGNRSKKNCLLKIKPKQIIDNNYRISFKMYQEEDITKVKAINDIVDENSKLTKDLETLNNKISIEVAKLLERKGG